MQAGANSELNSPESTLHKATTGLLRGRAQEVPALSGRASNGLRRPQGQSPLTPVTVSCFLFLGYAHSHVNVLSPHNLLPKSSVDNTLYVSLLNFFMLSVPLQRKKHEELGERSRGRRCEWRGRGQRDAYGRAGGLRTSVLGSSGKACTVPCPATTALPFSWGPSWPSRSCRTLWCRSVRSLSYPLGRAASWRLRT